MPVKIEMTTPTHEIRAYIAKGVERQRNRIIARLGKIGELCVNRARISEGKQKDFTDRTGNLRGSIGYILVVDGQIYTESAFEPVPVWDKKLERIVTHEEGPNGGRAFAERLASQCGTGIVLIVVAGMKYAKYVADKGFDVLDSAETEAEKLLQKLQSDMQ